MKAVYVTATAIFWLVIVALGGAALWPPARHMAAEATDERRFTLAEVARHGRVDDCWMAIHGRIYALTDYLPQHPTRPEVIVPWCGKDASRAYDTKNRNRPHSSDASELLQRYLIGTVGN